uniref:Solute carrier family 38 member 8a n=1 Tax=Astyanax mexicanus TaxID=7994 RepID=A0A8B9RFZ7_ASTMX
MLIAFSYPFVFSVWVSLYEVITGMSEGDLPHHWYTDQRFTLFLLCVFLILPLSVPKEIGMQKYIRISTWASMFSVIPTICFGFQCHEACIAIYSSMENKKLTHWVFISLMSMFFCLIIYSLTGIYGYMTFGKNVAPDVLMSYSGGDVLMIIARLLFGVSIITIYPIVVLLGRSVIQDPLLKRRGKHFTVTNFFEMCTRVSLTVTWIMTTLLIAVFVPDISKVISVIGGISAFFIFIFPGLCLIFAMQSQPVSARLRFVLIAWGVITLLCGTFIFGQSTALAIMHILNKL